MHCIEIIFEDIKKKSLDEIIREVLKLNNEDVISSHFLIKIILHLIRKSFNIWNVFWINRFWSYLKIK